MSALAFHFNAPDRLSYVCRLLRKAVLADAQLVVIADAAMLERVDAALWSFSAQDFVPHCVAGAPSHVLRASPIVLAPSLANVTHRDVVLNLGQGVPLGFEDFARVIEVVGLAEEDRVNARQRWKYYASLGHTITQHDAGSKTP